VTYYYWDFVTDNVFLEEDENGNVLAEYTHEPGRYGEPLAQERDGQVRYYNFDVQGSTRELTDDNGDVTDSYTYTAFGDEIAHTGSTVNPFRYKGALGYYTNSETNNIYVRERSYNPRVARWLICDPIRFIDRSNLYMFVGNNPINNSDVTGLCANCCCCIVRVEIDCSRNFIVDVNDRWLWQGVRHTGYIGHRFYVKATYKRILVPYLRAETPCEFHWWETADQDLPELDLKKDIPTDQATDESTDQFLPWRVRSKDCPLGPADVTILDIPSAEVKRGTSIRPDYSRRVDFNIEFHGSLSQICQLE
jgi:RHS repeat-associated protein